MKNKSTLICSGVIALLSSSSGLFAAAPAYRVEKSFGQNEIKSTPLCLSVDAVDQVHVLLRDGTVLTYGGDGNLIKSFKAEMTPAPTTMTEADGRIYLFGSVREKQVREVRGKKVEYLAPAGIKCFVYGANGAKESELILPDATSASDAHFIGKQLVVADYSKRGLFFYDLDGTKGTIAKTITNAFRLCCGIFDFCPGTDAGSLLVANLGAFKVQTFSNGNKTTEFGARGEKDNEFHGCCNPVNVACLGDGSIVTVEKSPTRVKIYDKDGKSQQPVAGLAELVDGCSVIPVAVDSKGAVYLASGKKNLLVKCVPGAPQAVAE